MDLLKLIIDPKKINNTCFLCYKCSDSLTNLHDKNDIRGEEFQYTLSLWNIMKELFPTYEFLLNQVCKDCSTLILKLFILLQGSQVKNEFLSFLIEDITIGLDQDNYARKKIKINVNSPSLDKILCKEIEKDTLFHCNRCDMVFKSKLMCQKHNEMHGNSDEATICDICGKTFVKSSSLKAHLNSHRGEQCPYCFKVLKSHSHYNVHVKNHKLNIIRKRNKKFYNCHDCVFKTLNKTSLEAHINKVHLNIRPHHCKICRKGFYKKSNLMEHLITHKKFKEKVCEICGDSFVNDKTLKEHLRLHTGHRPFKCGLCSSSFINSGRRYEHIARKHREKNKSCQICAKMFSLKKDLNSHLKTVHRVLLDGGNYVSEVKNVQIDLELIEK